MHYQWVTALLGYLLQVDPFNQPNVTEAKDKTNALLSRWSKGREEIKGTLKAKPLRRVWIPKPGRDEKRPLGIPTIKDRARQALIKSALEPEWESKMEETSYGFRPGRSAHDAISRIYLSINKSSYFVLDADIAKCFDRINHNFLLSKIHCPSALKRDIKQWLKAGVLDKGVFEETETGTPQGGVISPLLANIALDGMARLIETLFPKKGSKTQAVLIRYADDFVVISPSLEIIEQCKTVISEWLKPIGLELKPEKTRVITKQKCRDHNHRSGKITLDRMATGKIVVVPVYRISADHFVWRFATSSDKLLFHKAKYRVKLLTFQQTEYNEVYLSLLNRNRE